MPYHRYNEQQLEIKPGRSSKLYDSILSFAITFWNVFRQNNPYCYLDYNKTTFANDILLSCKVLYAALKEIDIDSVDKFIFVFPFSDNLADQCRAYKH